MTEDQVIEAAIQGHASTRDAIRWAIRQEREECFELCMDLHTLTNGAHNYYHFAANQIQARGEA